MLLKCIILPVIIKLRAALDIVWWRDICFPEKCVSQFNPHLFSHSWVWYSRQASTLASFTSCTTSMMVTTCPACPSAPWRRARTRWTATYHVPLRRRSSPSSWWSPLVSASSCVSVRWFTSSANASRNSLRKRLSVGGGISQRVTRWHRWQRPGQGSGPKHQSEWILQPLYTTSVTSRLRSRHLGENNVQYVGGHVEKLSKALKGSLQENPFIRLHGANQRCASI